ncbi:MAG: 30S ribosomal protein S4 [Acidobacteriota bacterium]
MGKYTGPVCRLCRTEGTKLFLKGRRCLTDKCGIERRSQPPGQRGKRGSFKKSNYKVQLREKQKVKRFYGLGEKQFRLFFDKAAKKKGITGDNLLNFLELRFDNILYRMNFASSRSQARQFIKHGHFTINGKKVSIPSYILKQNDEVTLKEKSIKNEKLTGDIKTAKGLVEVPEWLVVEEDKIKGIIHSIPKREDVSLDVEEHLIVELYSK